MELFDYLEKAKENFAIYDGITKAEVVLNRKRYMNIWVSVSGGADSDVMIDICSKLGAKVQYVFFDTGIEYKATKEHLKYLEDYYGITIRIEKALKPVPIGCREYGQPFLSKQISENIQRLQRHNFKWEDKPFDQLLKEYPKCKSALRWWCNLFGKNSRFNINYYKYLKEFMIEHPPDFLISNKCCDGAKKDVAKNFIKEHDVDLMLVGVRKAEGGARSTAYKTCFSDDLNGVAQYRPLFWYKNEDRKEYEIIFGIKHSDCYSDYGLKRTGCCGCPFGQDFEQELKIAKEKEPNLYKAVCNIFKDSYEYTRRYKEYRKMKGSQE